MCVWISIADLCVSDRLAAAAADAGLAVYLVGTPTPTLPEPAIWLVDASFAACDAGARAPLILVCPSDESALRRVIAILQGLRTRDPMLTLPDGQVDLESGAVRRGHGASQLTPTELSVLRYLTHHGAARADELLRKVWGYATGAASDVVKVTISRLRRKLELDPKLPRVLLTHPVLGYRLADRGR